MKNANNQPAKTGLTWLALFASTGTLVCCALPILFVSLGFGATVAAITSSLPLLITLSHYKVWIFIISGSLLIVSAWLMKRTKGQCPVDTELAKRCQQTQILNRRIWLFAVIIWSLGFLASYLALPIQQWFDF